MSLKAKLIKDLVAGEIFVDSLGFSLEVIWIKEIPWLGIPGTKPKVKVHFRTSRGHLMVQDFLANSVVGVK